MSDIANRPMRASLPASHRHAIVIGASMAGLLAARVLCAHSSASPSRNRCCSTSLGDRLSPPLRLDQGLASGFSPRRSSKCRAALQLALACPCLKTQSIESMIFP
jgi:hypothetical protein